MAPLKISFEIKGPWAIVFLNFFKTIGRDIGGNLTRRIIILLM
jgi:hypothetical protein